MRRKGCKAVSLCITKLCDKERAKDLLGGFESALDTTSKLCNVHYQELYTAIY